MKNADFKKRLREYGLRAELLSNEAAKLAIEFYEGGPLGIGAKVKLNNITF